MGNFNYTIDCIDKYINPRINECFERYNFHKPTQREGESFEHFLTECHHLVKTCNYNTNSTETAEEKALRDKILMGIRDPLTREALLRAEQLTLGKAIQFCRASEQSKNQSLQFQQGTTQVNEVKRKTRASVNSKATRHKVNVSNDQSKT